MKTGQQISIDFAAQHYLNEGKTLCYDSSNAPTMSFGKSGKISYNNLTDLPEFAQVAFSGDYNDLSNLPETIDTSEYAKKDWTELVFYSKADANNTFVTNSKLENNLENYYNKSEIDQKFIAVKEKNVKNLGQNPIIIREYITSQPTNTIELKKGQTLEVTGFSDDSIGQFNVQNVAFFDGNVLILEHPLTVNENRNVRIGYKYPSGGPQGIKGFKYNIYQSYSSVKDLLDDLNYITQNDLSNKQDVLESGTNIKTINNQSLLGPGNISLDKGTTLKSKNSTNTYDTKSEMRVLSRNDILENSLTLSNLVSNYSNFLIPGEYVGQIGIDLSNSINSVVYDLNDLASNIAENFSTTSDISSNYYDKSNSDNRFALKSELNNLSNEIVSQKLLLRRPSSESDPVGSDTVENNAILIDDNSLLSYTGSIFGSSSNAVDFDRIDKNSAVVLSLDSLCNLIANIVNKEHILTSNLITNNPTDADWMLPDWPSLKRYVSDYVNSVISSSYNVDLSNTTVPNWNAIYKFHGDEINQNNP